MFDITGYWFQSNDGTIPGACFDWYWDCHDRHDEFTFQQVIEEVLSIEPFHQVVHEKWVVGLLAWALDKANIDRKTIIAHLLEWTRPVLSKTYPIIGDPKVSMALLASYTKGEKINVDEVREFAFIYGPGYRRDNRSQEFVTPILGLGLRSIVEVSDLQARRYLANAIVRVAYAHTDLENGSDDEILRGMRNFLQQEIVPVIQSEIDRREEEILASRKRLGTG